MSVGGGQALQSQIVKPTSSALVEQLRLQAGTRSINVAALHASSVTSSDSARINGALMDDFEYVLKGNCVCLNNFVSSKHDLTLFTMLKAEIEQFALTSKSSDKSSTSQSNGDVRSSGFMDWSKHEVFEDPSSISATFNAIVELLDQYFDVEIYATRLNYYRDGNTWKPFHHDSHAYGGRALREDFTVGVSLGQSRDLQFVHEPSGRLFNFPQDNGDCFAFTNEVNTRFKHGVPKSTDPNCGDRFSIIAWGRRRSINERNGGGVALHRALTGRDLKTVDDAVDAAYSLVNVRQDETTNQRAPAQEAQTDIKNAKKKKNRLQ